MERNNYVVAHSVENWLAVTMTWIYTQLRSVNTFSHIILAGEISNIDQFPWDPIYSYPNKVHGSLIKAGRKIGIRIHPRGYKNAIEEHTPKLLHSHFGNRGWYDIPYANKYNLRHVITYYGSDISMVPHKSVVWRSRYHELFRHADLFLCEGPHMGKCLIELGCPEEKVKVQRLGIELKNIPFQPRQYKSGDEIKILIASTFREKKGIPYALRAIAEVRKKFPKIKITIIGDSTPWKPDEVEKKKILDVIKEKNLESVITMMGFQPYPVLIAQAYRHHIFLAPSITASNGDTEGGAPVSLIEMAASGMPVVSTLHCDIPQVFDKRSADLLSQERNVYELVEKLEWLMDNPDCWYEILAANRRHVETNFNSTIQADKLTNIYRSLV
jgi:colanic acid/amylovoran biosynthesis glycosyltransferase